LKFFEQKFLKTLEKSGMAITFAKYKVANLVSWCAHWRFLNDLKQKILKFWLNTRYRAPKMISYTKILKFREQKFSKTVEKSQK
jgi:hypothetical protein